MSRRPAASRSGFTLIELLTVIAIIGILAAIIIPTVGKVRKTAKNAQCVSNLRQWAQAVNLYANDNKGNYVIRANVGTASNPTWAQVTNTLANMHYGAYLPGSTVIGSLRNCPLLPPDRSGEVGYYINRPMNGAAIVGTDKVPLNKVRNPAKFFLFVDIDVTPADPNGHALIGTGGLATYVTPILTGSEELNRHSGKANMVFADCHVQAVTQADIDLNGNIWTRIDN